MSVACSTFRHLLLLAPRSCACFSLLILLLCTPSRGWALDPSKQIDQYTHGVWTSQHGLPGEAVYQILQTEDGYLWLRTSAGLVRFDGARFVSMDPVIGNGLVKAITQNANGDLLIRTVEKTLIYSRGVFSDYLASGQLPDGGIRTLFQDRAKDVLLGSDDFIYRLGNHAPQMLIRGTGHVDAFAEDRSGRVWIGGAFALYAYQNDALSTVLDLRPKGGGMAVSSLAVDRQQALWVGTWEGVYRSYGKELSLTRFRPEVIHGHIQALFEDHDANMWIGTDDLGLIRISGDHTSTFSSSDGLSDNKVLSVYEDREGTLWVGTASGLDQFRDTKVTTLTTKEGLPSNDTRAAFETREGKLYVFCIPGGLALVENNKATNVTNDGSLSYQGNGVFESRDSSLWMGTTGGLTRFKDGKFTVYNPEGRFSKYQISSISEDDESLIVTTSETVAVRFKDGKILPFTIHGQRTSLTSPGNYTITIYRDSAGNLWFGTVQGLFKFAPGQPPMQAKQNQISFPVTSISDDHKGNLWLGGRVPGLTRFRIQDGQVTHYRQKDGLFDDFPSRVLLDNDGNLWMSTSNGIYVANRQDLDDFAEGRVSKVRAQVFGTEDGMKTSEASLILSQPAGWRTADGRLWFTTTKGIVVADPKHMPHNKMIPPIVIEDVIANDHPMGARTDVLVPPGNDRVEFHYTALSLAIPEKVRFRYRLQGYDQDWVDAGSRRVAYYTNLPPGNYRFRVIACNNDGVWNESGASIGFALTPYYYQTGWFRGLCGLVIILAVVGLLRFNSRRLHARAGELTRLVDERTRTLQSEVLERQRAEKAAIEARERMRFQATHDPLTGFLNREAILDALASEISRSAQATYCTAVLMFDLDHFKDVNDRHGHLVGDAVLHGVAARLLDSIRSSDFSGRYGGEEFLIVLANCDPNKVFERAEELRRAVAASPILTDQGPLNVTTSVGVFAAHPGMLCSPDEVLRHADAALYEAKNAGRNRCCVAGEYASRNEGI